MIKNNIPVILLEGTGGCCDLFAKCYHLYDEYHPKQQSNTQSECNEKEEQIKAKIREKLQIVETQISTSKDLHLNEIDYFELIYECIDKQYIFLNFIDVKVHTSIELDVDLVILEALLNGKTNDRFFYSKKTILSYLLKSDNENR